jgi:hypothetical protein
MRPGISTRPPPSITVAFAIAAASIGDVDTRSIVLPLTSTLEGGESTSLLPSKIRTLRNSVASGAGGRCCVWPRIQISRLIAINSTNLIRLKSSELIDRVTDRAVHFMDGRVFDV